MKFSDNINNIQPSGTFKFFALMKEKLAKGDDIIPLVAGELDFNTPDTIAQAGIDAINNGHTRYTINSGIVELREAICQKLKTDNKLAYTSDQILVSSGSKQAIFNTIFALCGKGDEVIIFSPYYPSYPEIIKLAGATPVILQTEIKDDFDIDIDKLKQAITDKTKLIVLNSPNNPSGKVYSKETLETVSKIVLENDLYLLSDEIYEKILYDDNRHFSPAQLVPGVYDRTIIINGFSKTYAMTGWRIGYAAGPKELIEKAALVQSHTTSNAGTISQYAALEALSTGDDFVTSILPRLTERRDRAFDSLTAIKGIKAFKPNGAFYIFIDVSHYLQKKNFDSVELALHLLSKHKVGLVPGASFGAFDYIRLSFAADMATIEKGISRIKAGLEEL